jgi:hypothetical protein
LLQFTEANCRKNNKTINHLNVEREKMNLSAFLPEMLRYAMRRHELSLSFFVPRTDLLHH